MLAIANEMEAAVTRLFKDPNTKAIDHSNTTIRSNIDDDWSTIILLFTNNINIEFRLRPLFFTYEDGE